MKKFDLNSLLARMRTDTEFSQAVVRIPAGGLVGLYTAAYGRGDPIGANTPLDLAFVPSYFAYFGVAGLLVFLIWMRPGHFWYRRIVGIVTDLLALWGVLLLAGQVILPAFLGLLWIIVGNGIRFGVRYLVIAISGGIGIVIYLYHFNPFWNANPIMSLTLAGTLIVAPVYALALMGQLRQANAAVRLANAEKSKLLAQASHDLRHPLHALRLYANQLGQSELSPLQSDLLEKMQLATANANQMLQQFLDRSIIEAGILNVSKTTFSLGHLFADLVTENESWLKAAQIDVNIATKATFVSTDRIILRTLVQGLISNAVKYAPAGRVLIGARRRSDGIYVEVHDNGHGVGVHNRDNSQQLPPSAGVGLTLGQHLAQQAGYRLSFETELARGFCARIGPLAIAKAPTLSAGSPMLRSTPLSGASVSLDVHDEALQIRVRELLTSWGCLVQPLSHIAASGPPLAHICDTVTGVAIDFPTILLSDQAYQHADIGTDIIVVPTTGFSQLRSVLLARLLEAPAQARG
jgi:signal transduction histidine kinase